MDLGLESEGQWGGKKGKKSDQPEKDIASIPENDWETDCGPNSGPRVCFGVADHFVGVLVLDEAA